MDVEVSHLIFADDLLVFLKGDQRSIANVEKVLQEFGKQSGLEMNLEKSDVYLSGHFRKSVLGNEHLKAGNLPIRYLALPLVSF